MTSPDRGPEAEEHPRDPWERYGWLMWAPWLVFLGFPFLGAWTAEGASLPWRVVAVAGTVVFGVVYAIGSHRLSADQFRRHGALGVLAALVVAAGVTVPVLGLGVLGFLPFLQAFAAFALPRPWVWWFLGLVLLLGVVVPVLTGELDDWLYFGFILFAVTLATGAGRMMAVRGEAYSRVRDQLTVTAERDRVARDVHDVLGHSLTVVTVKAELAERLVDADPERAKAELADIQALSRQALGEVRATVGGLRAAVLTDELDAARTALRGAGIEPALPADPAVLDPRYRSVVAWVVREGVTNVVRHSGARQCRIDLAERGVTITDDGRGVSRPEGHGLRGLRERVEQAGGRLLVDRGADGAGTTVEVRW